MMMRKYLVGTAVLLLAATVVLWCTVNGVGSVRWFRSTHRICADLLADVPIGSSVGTVNQYIQANGFRHVSGSKTTGYLSSDKSEVGASYIRANLGRFHMVLSRVDVVGFFAFDEDGNLCAIDVRKYRDAP